MGCPKPLETNLVNGPIFKWVTALWNMYMNGQIWVFSGLTPKILTFEYHAKEKKLIERWILYVCSKFGQNLFRIGRKSRRWPPQNLVSLTSQHETAVISRATSKSPRLRYFLMCYLCLISEHYQLWIHMRKKNIGHFTFFFCVH